MNKLERREYDRAYRKRNAIKIAARLKKYYIDNKDRLNRLRLEWLSSDRGKAIMERYKLKKRKIDKAYSRERRRNNPGLKTEEFRLYRLRNKEKVAAHQEVRKALLKGSIKRSPCEVCGEKRKRRVHAHHDDYSKPLSVRWLCVIHHKLAHKTI